MGVFGKTVQVVKDLTVEFIETANTQANELRELKEKYREMDDDKLLELIRKDGLFSKSQKEKGVIFGELRRRGYETDEISKK